MPERQSPTRSQTPAENGLTATGDGSDQPGIRRYGAISYPARLHEASALVTALLLGYEDLDRARTFFVEALGFEEEWENRGVDGALIRSHVRLGDTVLLLDRPGAHNVLSPRVTGGVTHLIVISVGDVDAHHARALEAGATILAPPSDRAWGRDYELIDPEGYVFSFIS